MNKITLKFRSESFVELAELDDFLFCFGAVTNIIKVRFLEGRSVESTGANLTGADEYFNSKVGKVELGRTGFFEIEGSSLLIADFLRMLNDPEGLKAELFDSRLTTKLIEFIREIRSKKGKIILDISPTFHNEENPVLLEV